MKNWCPAKVEGVSVGFKYFTDSSKIPTFLADLRKFAATENNFKKYAKELVSVTSDRKLTDYGSNCPIFFAINEAIVNGDSVLSTIDDWYANGNFTQLNNWVANKAFKIRTYWDSTTNLFMVINIPDVFYSMFDGVAESYHLADETDFEFDTAAEELFYDISVSPEIYKKDLARILDDDMLSFDITLFPEISNQVFRFSRILLQEYASLAKSIYSDVEKEED